MENKTEIMQHVLKNALNFLLHKHVKLICRSVFVDAGNAGFEKVK